MISVFRQKAEQCAAVAAALVAGSVFFYHLSPGVTLKDSGELVTAAFSLGVPHPPGYPLWTLLGFFWSHFVLPFGNPAWRIGVLSGVTGGLTVGVLALTMIRCTRVLLESLPWSKKADVPLQRWISISVGVSTALLFGFSRGVWAGACVPEMRALQVLLAVAACCAYLTWLIQPDRRGFLYAAIFLFAVGFAARGWAGHAVAVSIYLGALAAGIDHSIGCRCEAPRRHFGWRTLMPGLSVFWELCIAGLLGFIAWTLVVAWVEMPRYNPIAYAPWPLTACTILVAFLAAAGRITGWWSVRRALACAGMLVVGYAINLYLPLAAATNPPMNWGYTASKEMFLHMLSRGSYETWGGAMTCTNIFAAFKGFSATLVEQYSLPLTLLTLTPLAVVAVCRSRPETCSRAWLIFLWIAFLATGLSTLPDFTWRRSYPEYLWPALAPAHALYAMLIGLGIAAIVSLVAGRRSRGSGVLVRWACVGLLALPLITFTRNLPVCTQRGNDFGYRFGHLLFEPGHGVPSMEKDAILFAGTDAARFVATYMVFCESRFAGPTFDRSDVHVIAQNALADYTYMNTIRDQYDASRPEANRPETMAGYPAWRRFMFKLGWNYLGRDHAYPTTPIHLLSEEDSNRAFQEYVKDVQSGRFPDNTGFNSTNGYCTLRYAGGVMHINGILARMIFDRNKDEHAFYVEESYVIPWMYPHLRPCGLIMKLEKDPLPSPEQDPGLWDVIKARDRAYWEGLTGELLSSAEFCRDHDAKATFSKLRCAIAGLYGARGLIAEAEHAFLQALQLCPESNEVSFRLADLYDHSGRPDAARKVMEDYLKIDGDNRNVRDYLDYLKTAEAGRASR